MRNDMTRLGDLCEFKYGKSLPEILRHSGPIAVYGSNGIVGQHNEAITHGSAVIIGRKGSVGAVHLSERPCWPIDTTYYVEKDTTEVDLPWLARALRNLHLPELNKAAAVPGLNRNDAYELRLFVPPREQQRRIAAILDQADDLRRKRRVALASTERIAASLLRSHDKQLPSSQFRRVKLGEIAMIATGSTPSRKATGLYGGQIPWVKTTEVALGEIITKTEECVTPVGVASARLKLFPANSIIIAMYGQGTTRGKVARLGIAATVNQACAVVIPNNDFEPEFLFSRLVASYEKLRDLGRGGNQPNLNLDLVRSFEILLLPLDVQRTFAAQIAQIDKLKTQHHAHLAKLDALFASLQHRAFRGEL